MCHQAGPGNHVGLKLNGTHHLLVYADDLNLSGNNKNTKWKTTEALIDANKVAWRGWKCNENKLYVWRLITKIKGKNHIWERH